MTNLWPWKAQPGGMHRERVGSSRQCLYVIAILTNFFVNMVFEMKKLTLQFMPDMNIILQNSCLAILLLVMSTSMCGSQVYCSTDGVKQ